MVKNKFKWELPLYITGIVPSKQANSCLVPSLKTVNKNISIYEAALIYFFLATIYLLSPMYPSKVYLVKEYQL